MMNPKHRRRKSPTKTPVTNPTSPNNPNNQNRDSIWEIWHLEKIPGEQHKKDLYSKKCMMPPQLEVGKSSCQTANSLNI